MTNSCWSLGNALEAKRTKSVGCSLEMSHDISRSLRKSHDISRSLGKSHDICCSLRMTHTMNGKFSGKIGGKTVSSDWLEISTHPPRCGDS